MGVTRGTEDAGADFGTELGTGGADTAAGADIALTAITIKSSTRITAIAIANPPIFRKGDILTLYKKHI
jgi:hypothetical protein